MIDRTTPRVRAAAAGSALLTVALGLTGCSHRARAEVELEQARKAASEAAEAAEEAARQEAHRAELAELAALAAEIQVEVAELRGLAFQRDVPVEIADTEAFRAYAGERMESVGDERQRDAQELIAKLLGLIPPDMDYWGETIEILGGQVGGYYDPDRDTFSIMEGVTGPLARSILSHELVHALDDQHFDLGGALEARSDDTDRLAAYHAVVEGSAMLIQNVWTIQHIGEFTAEDIAEMSDVTPEELFEAPAYVWLPVLFSYFRGQCFLLDTESLMEAQTTAFDAEELNRAFREPPRSTEQILHPAKYWDADAIDDPVTLQVTVADAASGWEPVHGEVLGELGLFLVADGHAVTAPDMKNPLSFLSLAFTSDAATGWEGDKAQLFEKGAQRMLVLATLWETEADRDEFAAAVEARSAALGAAASALAADLGLGIQSVVTQPRGEREFQLVVGLGVGTPDLLGLPFEVTTAE